MYGFGLLAAALVSAQAAAAQHAVTAAPEGAAASAAGAAGRADFRGEVRTNGVGTLADRVVQSRDNAALPFVIIDKVAAKVFVFDRDGRLTAAAPALLGLARGDDTVPGIGQRRLATMKPGERTTPAGRFVASLGHDLEQDVLWVDYDSALSLHRVVAGRPDEARAERLASASGLDNRISYGCINVPTAFYDAVVKPAFKGTAGIVYILPEVRALEEVFAMIERDHVGPVPTSAVRQRRLNDSRLPDPR